MSSSKKPWKNNYLLSRGWTYREVDLEFTDQNYSYNIAYESPWTGRYYYEATALAIQHCLEQARKKKPLLVRFLGLARRLLKSIYRARRIDYLNRCLLYSNS